MYKKEDKSISTLCAQDESVQDVCHDLIQAATKIETDNLGFLTSLMSLRLAINRFYVSQDKELGAQDARLVFDELIKQFTFELNLRQSKRIYQLFEHTYSFTNRALKNHFKHDAVLDILRPRGAIEDVENAADLNGSEGVDDSQDINKSREYLYFLVQNLSMDMSSFLGACLGDNAEFALFENKVQEKKDHIMLENLTRGIHIEIGNADKSTFNERFQNLRPQEITHLFKKNALTVPAKEKDLRRVVQTLEIIARTFKNLAPLTRHMDNKLSLGDECYTTSDGRTISYQQELDECIKSIFDNPLLVKHPQSLISAMKSCTELADIAGYKPQELTPAQKAKYDVLYAKAKVIQVIVNSQSRLGGLFQSDTLQRSVLTKAEQKMSDLESLQDIIMTATNLSEEYGRRGGIYTIPNIIWDFLIEIFHLEPAKSRTQVDLSKVIAELEDLKMHEYREPSADCSLSIH
ncbi:hypothetical protein BN59_01633 [Legionella massiliensis]|uniref:Uncharacterized protein n=1 Tax=Legionella massiliensis TaxID=1034943 RepID=A0A078KSB7_9GAMM|nr:hypothetical protein [Legionella massiliensis]CDZ77350.1 hypothetical protein BN59_01633 [Legionella massiliensis]CEE13088.1 hypothetical protein BN1094_01633 [Legionella massiliensis]